jgi:hypothetical protein
MASFSLTGEGMCKSCHNGFHRPPGQPACDVIIDDKSKKLCICPCHLPKKLLALTPKRCKRAPRPEQAAFDVPTNFIGGGALAYEHRAY